MSEVEVKITMLGSEGAGKTCYMLGLYAMMRFGIEGLTLATTNMDEDLRLASLWENLVEEQGEDRWPPPNEREPYQYEFDFSYGMRRLVSFDWLDYRGGAMQDKSEVSDVQRLLSRLRESTCVFLCISGEYLQGNDLTDAQLQVRAGKAGVTRMVQYLNDLSKNLSDRQRPFPIVIVITKYDLCQQRGRAVIDDIKKMLSALFMPNKDWLVMICPVSLGKELEQDRNNGRIDPKFLHLPLVFAIYAKFREYLMTEQERVKQNKGRVDTLSQAGWLQRILQGGAAEGARGDLDLAQTQLEDLQKKMALLADKLSNTQIYLGGKEVEASWGED